MRVLSQRTSGHHVTPQPNLELSPGPNPLMVPWASSPQAEFWKRPRLTPVPDHRPPQGTGTTLCDRHSPAMKPQPALEPRAQHGVGRVSSHPAPRTPPQALTWAGFPGLAFLGSSGAWESRTGLEGKASRARVAGP